jgi:DNA-binding NarL/FixJ family response regulator
VLFLIIHEDDEYVSAAFSAGASGYVTKQHIASDLARAIQEVARGDVFLSQILRRAQGNP